MSEINKLLTGKSNKEIFLCPKMTKSAAGLIRRTAGHKIVRGVFELILKR
jgi:hypothetical protein